METGIRIDQALFGYREGHRLLQASRRFTPGAERSLLILTDMSGPRTVEGFEEYVSGYPLDGEDSYAIVKTWYAPEMERPGCVWSHVLLIANDDLAFIRSVSSLLPLFNRPSTSVSGQYQTALWLQQSIPVPTDSKVIHPAALLPALYEQYDKPVMIPAYDSFSFQATVFAIWSQQWPALRSSFTFCTGSLSNRTIGGRSFDLQVVPFKLMRELQRDFDGLLLDLDSTELGEYSAPNSEWISPVIRDLANGGGPFRDFIWRYADPLVKGLPLFKKLATLYVFLHNLNALAPSEKQEAFSTVTQQIASVYPSPTNGATLKQDFYGYRVQDPGSWGLRHERVLLGELATTPHYVSLDVSQLDLRLRANDRWRFDREYAQSLLFSLLDRATTPFADEIIAGFVDSMSAEDVCKIASTRGGLLLALVVRNAKLLTMSDFWRCGRSPDTYYGILDYLRTDEGATVSRNWLSCAIESGPKELARPLVEGFGEESAHAILDRATANTIDSGWVPTESWRTALASNQSVLIALLDRTDITNSTRAMTVLAGLLDSHQAALETYGLRPWLELCRGAKDLIFEFPNAEAAAFLLSLGFTHTKRETTALMAVSFEHVHAAAHSGASDPLSYRAWKMLERDVPALPKTRNWDKCERLRQALIEKFIRNQWPRVDFLRCASRPDTLRSICYSSRDVRGGEDFIRALAEDISGGAVEATEGQRQFFTSSFRRNWQGELKFKP
jgi:hypothetical protein